MASQRNWIGRMGAGVGAVVVAAAIVAGIVAAGDAPSATESRPAQSRMIPVEFTTAELVTKFDATRTFTGTIEAARASELAFERSGRLVAVAVEEGDDVYQGKVLAQLDTRHLEAQREELKAQHAAAKALLEEYIAGPRQETIAAARADVADLQSQFEHARARHERNAELRRKSVISQEDYDESAFGVRSAQARWDAAQRQLDELLAGTRKERIAAQQAAVAQLDAALKDLEIDITDSQLTAPFPGRVAQRHVDEGTIVSPNMPVLRLVENVKREARIGLPVELAAQISVGSPQQVLIGEKAYPATVTAVLPELDLVTRTRTVVFTLDTEAGEHVVPGQVARVEIAQAVEAEGYWLPTAALSRGRRGLWSVLVIASAEDESGEIAERRDVEILHTAGERVLVRGTLQEGDRVITGGTHRIVAGQAVSGQTP